MVNNNGGSGGATVNVRNSRQRSKQWRYIKLQRHYSRASSSLQRQKDCKEAISLLESKHADYKRQEGDVTYMRWQ